MNQKHLLSVVVPIYCEEQVLHEFYKRVKNVLVSLGLVGQYIGRIHRRIKHRPLYIVAEKYGFDHSSNKTASEKKASEDIKISDIGE